MKITADETAFRDYGLALVKLTRGHDQILTDEPGVLGWGGNGGFHALNLAVQFGARRIILVGYDLHIPGGRRDQVHWHGAHGRGLNNPAPSILAKWRATFDAAAPRLKALGVEVLNASPASALTAYPKVSLEEALKW